MLHKVVPNIIVLLCLLSVKTILCEVTKLLESLYIHLSLSLKSMNSSEINVVSPRKLRLTSHTQCWLENLRQLNSVQPKEGQVNQYLVRIRFFIRFTFKLN